jgi:hypothetical protein
MKKSFLKMIVLFLGCTLCHGGRTVCGCLRTLGMHGEKAFANYHHLLSRSKISMLQASRELLRMVIHLAGPSIILVVDEHLERRRGRKIKAKATYRDPVASSKSRIVRATGLKWVVVSVLVPFPWTNRSFALPIMSVLRKPEDHPKNLKRYTRTGIDLACQMLMVIRRWYPDLSITLVGDGDYARVKLCVTCTKLSIPLISLMRADSRLHDFIPPGKNKGLPRKTGSRLKKPSEDLWEGMQVKWYGGRSQEIMASGRNCLWLAGKERAIIPLKAVWVRLRAKDEILLMSTGLHMEIKEIVELYVKRWNIEVTFRECRDYLGVETQREWSDQAVERTTPLLFSLYTLITLMANDIYQIKGIKIENTAWYTKQCLTFSDLLAAVRREIGSVNSHILNSILCDELQNWGINDAGIDDPPDAVGF